MRTVKEALALAADDLDTATSFLTLRHLAGDAALTTTLQQRWISQWGKRSKRWLAELAARVQSRHAAARRGGLPARAQPEGRPRRPPRRARAALGRSRASRCCSKATTTPSRRPTTCCSASGSSSTARPVGPVTCCSSRSRTPSPRARRARRRHPDGPGGHRGPHHRLDQRRGVAPGAVVADGAVGTGVPPRPPGRPRRGAARGRGPPRGARPARPTTRRCVLRVATAAARHRLPHRAALARPAGAPRPPTFPDAVARGCRRRPGRAPARRAEPAIPVLESLDQRGLLVKVAARVGARPQPAAAQRLPPLHRRPAPLGGGGQRRGAGRPGLPPRPARGRRAAARPRQGLPGRPHRGRDRAGGAHRPPDGLRPHRHRGAGPDGPPPPPAPRRRHRGATCPTTSPSTPSPRPSVTPASWSCWPRSPRPTRSPPDRRRGAPGRPSWSPSWPTGCASGWAATPAMPESWSLFPSAEVLALMGAGRTRAARPSPTGSPSWPPTVPGSSPTSPACSRCTASTCSGPRPTPTSSAWRRRSSASPPEASLGWERVVRDLERSLAGQLALEARLAERARTYARRRTVSVQPAMPQRLDRQRGVVERHGRGGPGRPTASACSTASRKALADLGLDIRHARIQTLGHEVVDTFYVRTASKAEGHRRLPPRRGRAGAAPRRVRGLTGRGRSGWRGGGPITLRGMAEGAEPADFTRDLLRWSDSLAGIARTGSASPRASTSGSATRRC